MYLSIALTTSMLFCGFNLSVWLLSCTIRLSFLIKWINDDDETFIFKGCDLIIWSNLKVVQLNKIWKQHQFNVKFINSSKKDNTLRQRCDPLTSCSSWLCLQRQFNRQVAGSKFRRFGSQYSPTSSGRDGTHAKALQPQPDWWQGKRTLLPVNIRYTADDSKDTQRL